MMTNHGHGLHMATARTPAAQGFTIGANQCRTDKPINRFTLATIYTRPLRSTAADKHAYARTVAIVTTPSSFPPSTETSVSVILPENQGVGGQTVAKQLLGVRISPTVRRADAEVLG